jgi:hypothetical protein
MFRFSSILALVFAFVIANAQQRLYPVCTNQMWGMMDAKGNLVVEADYKSIGGFEEEGYAIAQKGDLLGVIDTLGKVLIPCKYSLMDYVGKGLFSIKDNGTWKIINTADKVVLDSMSGKITFLENDYLTFDEIGGIGLAHIDLGVLLPPVYSNFQFLSPELVVVFDKNYSKSLFDGNGKQILPTGFELFKIEGNLIWGKRSGKWGAYDFQGNTIIKADWTSYKALGTNFYSLTNEKKIKFLYSTSLDSIILSEMKSFSDFDNTYAQFVNFEDNKGLIDVNGNFVFEGLYNAISKFGDNTFRLRKGEHLGVMDTKGNVLAPFIYKTIGRPNSQVAIVKRNENYGILNLNGELVLPAVYPVSLSLDDNVARYKDPKGVLQIFVFDEVGQLKNNTKFTNLKSLRIRSSVRTFNRNPMVVQNGTPIEDPNQISDSLVWQFHVGARKWGLWNVDKKKYKVTPQYDNVLILKDLGLTIVGKVKREIGGYIKTGRLDLQINRVFGLFTNVHGLPITKMEFLDIRLSDFQEKDYDIARCVFIGGSHGILSRKGRILSRGYVYIGEFVEGRARTTRKGKLLVDMDYKIKRPLMKAEKYFRGLNSNYGFDNDDDPRLYTSFARDGQLYCKDAKWGYIDTFGQVFLNYKYDYVEDYTNGRALVRHKGQWGMLDNDGNSIIEPQYDDFNFLPKSDKKLFFIAEYTDLKGAIDSNANIIVPVEYSRIREFHDNRIAVRGPRGWGFVDRNAKEVIPATYRVANDFSEELAVIYEKSKWGVINKNGDVVVKAQYSRMGNFKEGKAWVNLNKGNKGYINKYGDLLFSGKYTRLTDFKDGIARVYVRKRGWGLIDVKGNYILKPKKSFKKIEAFNEHGLAKVKIGKKYRLINQEGKLVGKKAFGLIRDFKEGHAVIRVQVLGSFRIGKPNLNFGFIDTIGELVTKEDFRQLQDFSEGRAVYTGEGSKRGYLNYKGEVVVNPQYFRAENFNNNRAVVWESYNKTGVIDTTGGIIIPVAYDKILGIKEGLALVRKNSWTYYFVHEDTKRHSPSDFRGASTFQNNMAPIQQGHKWGVINEKGLKTLTPKYAYIAPYQDGIAKVSVKSLLGVVDVDGKIIIDAKYEYIDYVGEGLFRVERGDKMGYLDMVGNWVWEMQ